MAAEQEERVREQFIEAEIRANRIFVVRMMGYFARRYGKDLEIGPAVLWAIIQEHNAIELGQDFDAIRSNVDELLDTVEYIGDASSTETCKLAQAWMILARIVAGEPKSARTLRESLAAAIDLLDAAAPPYRGANRVAFAGVIGEGGGRRV